MLFLRNNWNYEVNGLLTKERKEEYLALAERMRTIFYKVASLEVGIKTYRGVSIEAFRSYQIHNLNELVYLKDKYLYEEGFTSTSLIKEKSFYQRDVYTLTGKPNILIECFIPVGSDDGIPLVMDDVSYSKGQCEFVINSSSLFKVIDVSVDEIHQTASMKVLLIPEKVWNYQDYICEREGLTR